MAVGLDLGVLVFFNLVNWFICLTYVSLKEKHVLKLMYEAKLGVAEAAAVDARKSPSCVSRS